MKTNGSISASKHPFDSVVFLTPRPVSKIEEKKWNFEYLRSQGFSVYVIDLTWLLHKKSVVDLIVASVTHPVSDEKFHQVRSCREFESLVKSLAANSMFVDFIIGLSAITLREERVFRILKKYSAKYAVLSTGALPLVSSTPVKKVGKGNGFLAKVNEAILDPRKLFNYCVSKGIIFLTKRRLVYPLPEIIFGGQSEILSRFVAQRSFESRVVAINSSDYDLSSALLRESGGKLPRVLDICVFLDEAATHHSDFKMLGIQPPSAEIYFSQMNRYFDSVEKSTGLKVVIAAHPRSNYESIPDAFNGRTMIKGRTSALIAQSRLVIAHMSTALSFAVIFKKPVVFVKIPGLPFPSHLNYMVETMASALGNIPVDLEMAQPTSATALQFLIDDAKYSEYERRYIKSPGAESLSCWEIFVKALK